MLMQNGGSREEYLSREGDVLLAVDAAELRGDDVADVHLEHLGDLQPPRLLVVAHQVLLPLLLLEVEAVGPAHRGAHVVLAGGRGLRVDLGARAEVVGVPAVLLAVLADLGLYVLVDLLAQLQLGLLQRLLLPQLLMPQLHLLHLVYLRHHLLELLVLPQRTQLLLPRAVVHLALELRRAHLLKPRLPLRQQVC